ncbi:MAG TPA: UDP-N-acetylglucosamine 2-epimerase [Bacteroidia bacterium]|jgi:GDP/UDP-N,N'-diacetylbacillosamine 2-epimerase (hydrolysing)
MNIAVLTSSRADYGIYLPLLKKLQKDNFFDLHLIAFGTHLSEKFGHTIDQIAADGFTVKHRIETLPEGDRPEDISKAMGKTIEKFSRLWATEKSHFDLILCLGDRYEMFAAVSASVPFAIPVAHLHGGETTLGAIDNAFRHSITCMSKIHFASTALHAARVEQITASAAAVYNVGALSLDNLHEIELLDVKGFQEKFGIHLENPVLVTFHPETVEYEKNQYYVTELIAALDTLDQQIIITMPNADTMGDVIRNEFITFAGRKSNVFTVESLGTQGYFFCLLHCAFVLGNSSSGIIEAASFGKYVVDLGKRQAGREAGENIIHTEIKKEKILDAINQIKTLPALTKKNIYGDGKTADRIIELLKKA